jgi:hypothetical protein
VPRPTPSTSCFELRLVLNEALHSNTERSGIVETLERLDECVRVLQRATRVEHAPFEPTTSIASSVGALSDIEDQLTDAWTEQYTAAAPAAHRLQTAARLVHSALVALDGDSVV